MKPIIRRGHETGEGSVVKRLTYRLLDWALDPSDCLPLAVLQGTIVIAVGAGIAVREYVTAGRGRPSRRGGWA